MKKTVKSGVSSLALAAVLVSGFVGVDAASAKGKSATIEPNPPSVEKGKSATIPSDPPSVEKGKSANMPPIDPNDKVAARVPKKKSNWIFPAMGALTVAAAVLVATGDNKPASP